ncbi:uncharacterized protein Z518_05767 [Rhinocladiella mackenziei CBS 650.93]|uniref:Uncharacterized protein n=1 Tax=Rhinocladiella mackenziei CBS 650.93 TaxID=1442369 RepID=A0A0D2IP23_9EURO|nr:uncharacterized protein Z518_05767 [Rhinocladiella mackenziei CBS 650.93]KIX04896.1 hypothetical protein Z518_05767 [Rhinocladiella mackenziei CBS 650.93]
MDIIGVTLSSGVVDLDALTDQAMTFLGQDTKPRLREDVRAKINSPSESQGAISRSTIDDLPYLNALCNEPLRLHSPVLSLLRVAVKPVTVCGINGGWSNREGVPITTTSPSAEGPRECVGEGFARAGMAVVLAALVGRYEFEFVGTGEEVNSDPDEVKVEKGITAKIEGGLYVRARRINGW